MRNLNWPNATTGEPDDTERVLSGSGRGGEKRPGNGTSLAAYFIALSPNACKTEFQNLHVSEGLINAVSIHQGTVNHFTTTPITNQE